MDSFEAARRFERECWEGAVRPYVAAMPHVRAIDSLIASGLTAEQCRAEGYDFAVTNVFGVRSTHELKAERRWTGNLFLETWSNKAFGRARDGWMFHTKAEWVWYYFADTGDLYQFRFFPLWDWFIEHGNVFDRRWPEKPQTKNAQKNRTFGHCVPVEFVAAVPGIGWAQHKVRFPGAAA